jgi:hypothetical protein
MNSLSYLEAKDFFTRKILEQAKRENVTLSSDEIYALSLNIDDPTFFEIFDEEYVNKIARLLRNAFDFDINANNPSDVTYSEAYKAIKPGNYYIFIIIDKAIGKDINKLGYFFGKYDSPSEYILNVVLWGLLLIFVTALFLYKNDFTFQQIKARTTELFSIIALGILIFLNIKSYIKYRKDDIFSNKTLKRDAAKGSRAP